MLDFIKNGLKLCTVLILVILTNNGLAQSVILKDASKHSQIYVDRPFSSNILNDANNINFRKINNMTIIKVIIDDKGPYNFLLDTGMSTSFISENLAQELELQHLLGANALINNVPHDINVYRLKSLKIGGAEMYDYDVIVMPEPGILSTVNKILQTANIMIDGAIGFGAFHDFLFTLDVKTNTIILKTGSLDSNDKNTFGFENRQNVPIMPITIKDDKQNEMKLNVLIDSGFYSQFLMPSSIISLPFKILSKKSARNEMLTRYVMANEVKISGKAIIGNQEIKDPILLYSDKPYEGKEKLDFGLMGMEVLKTLKITFDQKNNLIKFE